MANLATLLNTLTQKSGYLHHQLDSEQFGGTEKTYRFWMQWSNVINRRTVKILVKDEGEPTEEATMFHPTMLDEPSSTFQSAIDAALPTWLSNHTEVEHIRQDSIDEINEIANYTIWVYVSGNDNVIIKNLVVYKIDTSLTVRELA